MSATSPPSWKPLHLYAGSTDVLNVIFIAATTQTGSHVSQLPTGVMVSSFDPGHWAAAADRLEPHPFTILIIVLLIVLLGGGGGYSGYNRYGTAGSAAH